MHAVEDGAIVDLSLIITLRTIQRREPMNDLVLIAEGSNLSAGEVCSLVGYDGMREDEATYEVLPHEFDHLLPCNFGEAQLRPTW